MTKKLFIIFLLVSLAGCGFLRQKYSITDAAKPETITLRTKKSKVYALTVAVQGHLDGPAEIVLVDNGERVKTEHLSGDVDFEWDVDWYSDTATIEYKPLSRRGGQIDLHYVFGSL